MADHHDQLRDSIRTNLIMHFHCAECGEILRIAYEDNAAKPKGRTEEQEPTGAAVRYVPSISVEPCRTCIEKHTGPAKQLARALKAMEAANG